MSQCYIMLDTETGTLEPVMIEDYKDINEHLKSRCFDVTRRKIGNIIYDLFVDDEGLLKKDSIPSAINRKGEVVLVGNIIFAKHDSDGEMITTNTMEDFNILHNMAFGRYNDRIISVVVLKE